MQSLPAEILHLIVGHLYRSSHWPFARSCKAFYQVIRPSLFRFTTIKLALSDGRVNAQQLDLCKEILNSRNDKQAAGHYIETLIVLFKDDESESTDSDASLGVMEALGALLRLAGSTRELVIDGMPDSALPSEAEAASHAISIERFKQSLRQLSKLERLECSAADEKSSSIWLKAILSSLPDSLQQLFLMPDFGPDLYPQALQPNYFTRGRILIRELYFSCPEPGQECDHLLSSVMDNSPFLTQIWIAEQCLTTENVMTLFNSERKYEHLVLETVDIPRVSECRLELSGQTHLIYLDARCGSDFLYYLAFLPPSVKTLKLSVRVYDPVDFRTEQSLEEVWGQVKYCLEDSHWCPQLEHLHIDLETKAENDEYDSLVADAREMRDQALILLGKRETIPTTNEDFWSFDPNVDKDDDGWKAGISELARRMGLTRRSLLGIRAIEMGRG